MTIKVGDKLPSVTFKRFADGGFTDIKTDEFFAGKTVLLFGIPGAFTPVCQGNHLPGYVEKAMEFKEGGIDELACISVNDCFVMKAFGSHLGTDGKIAIADDSATFTNGIGLAADATSFGLGIRSERYAMIVKDGTVESLSVEDNFVDHKVSSADEMLKTMRASA